MNTRLIILIILITIASCRKPIPPDIQISASGIAIDTVKNKKLANATVYVRGCNYNFYGLFCHDSVTSIKTNMDGSFSLSFLTDGKYRSY